MYLKVTPSEGAVKIKIICIYISTYITIAFFNELHFQFLTSKQGENKSYTFSLRLGIVFV